MFKKLRRQFLWGSAGVLLAVVLLVILALYLVSSSSVSRQTRVLIDLALENDGALPMQAAFDRQQETFLALNGESIHEARYFSALLSAEGDSIVAYRLAGLSEEEALTLARSTAKEAKTDGQVQIGSRRTLYYGSKIKEDGSVLIVFMDSSTRNGLTRLLLIYTGGIWFIVLVLYILLMTHFSKKLIRPFVENDERQKRFITNASHELKTPLAVISANNEMAEVIGGKTKWTESTGRQVKRLQSLIEDLVVLTRLDEMKELSLSELDLSRIVTETAEPFRSVAESAGRTFTCDIAPQVPVRGEKRALQQIVSILTDNAVKYCDEGGEISLRLAKSANGKTACLSVSNTYAEGKDVDTSRFFERFYREDESHHSARPGFGIGLSMAQEIMDRLKGRLKVAWAEGVITFTAEIPAVREKAGVRP